MKTIDEFISHLHSLNVKLWVEGDRLRYRAPHGTMTPALTAELQQCKAEILTFLDYSNIASIQPVPDKEYYDLSHAQRRLWILSQLDEGSCAYNIPLSVLFEGDLDREAFERALTELVRRHESLRTTFVTVDGEPRQRVHDKMDFRVAFINLMEDPRTEEAARMLVRQEALKPFNLERGPLLRVSLMKLAGKQHVMFLALHHIVSDGVSLGVLAREFIQLYRSIHKGEPISLPALRIQYRDFANWQNRLLESKAVVVHRTYWHEKLSGEIPVLSLPTDFPRPAVQTFNGKELAFTLSLERTRALLALSRRQGATLFMTLMAMVKVLLHRYTGQRDIIVGSPIAGRNHADLENQIGLYLNTLALRDQLRDDISFETFLQQVKQTAMAAYDHQIYPFDRLVGELNLSRDLSRSPLFDVMVILQNTEIPELSLENVQTRAFFQESRISKFDLTFDFEEGKDGLHVGIEYNTDLFLEDRIERMGGHFRKLLDSILVDASQSIARLNILPASEQRHVLYELNATEAQYPRDQTIVDLFEGQVEQTPDSVAVMFGEAQLTYRELNLRANQVAHHLRALRVGAGTLVAIYLERSLEMVAGLLGILKAGGAYVPLDPAYPKERLGFMLEDSQAPVVLTRKNLMAGLPEQRTLEVCLDTDLDAILQKEDQNPVRGAGPGNLAYVIYTSGSTGRPKGVGISHQSLVNFLTSMRRQPGLTDQDAVLAVTTTAFDIAALELYLPLIVGAKVVLVSRQEASDGSLLLNRLVKSRATVMQATPATWRLLLDAGWEGSDQLKIFCGGEALSRELSRQLLERGASVWNLYGPTETTVWSTTCKVDPEQLLIPTKDAVVPIGRPIANTDIYILDRYLQPVPLGVPGELHIGGAGVAQGYLDRPELTAEKFIPNPFSKESGARLYKTGDLVCYRSDGNIEFFGRMDDQVKIRGFRIELEEVEAVLGDHPAIRETVITAREDHSGDKRLVAYVVPNETQAPSASELHSFLKKKLPDYMVPSAFAILDALPRTLNGKVNRRALPAPDRSRPGVATYVAPRNKLEQGLAAIWQDLLNLEKVGVRDSFFDLGGHSLKAAQMMSRIHRDLGVEVALREIFNQPTIEELASEIASRSPSAYVSIPRVADADHYPVSHAQRRLWVLSQMGESSAAYSMPDALLLEGEIDREALEHALCALLERHESLRTTFITVDEELRQRVHQSIESQLSFVDLTAFEQPEIQARELARQDAQTLFDLQRGPLIRISLLKLAEKRHVLLSNMHHIISDGWSIAVLEREFVGLYQSFHKGQDISLPPLRIQYRDFASWQNSLLDSNAVTPHRDYWLEKLAGEIPVLNLRTDFPRPAVKTFNGKTLSFNLQSRALLAFSRRKNATLFMTLAALLKVLLHRYSDQQDIIIGCPVAGRDHADLKDQIGFYVNTLPLRSQVQPDLSFEAFLDLVRKTCTEAYEHQAYPFDRLVHELNLNRDISRSPLFDVMLVLQNVEASQLSFEDLRIAPFFDQYATSQFDLTFSFEERDDALHGTLWYNTDLFLPDRIARLSHHFQQLVASILNDASQPVGQLKILPEPERQKLLHQFNTAADFPCDQTIVELFEAQVERTPEAVALVFEDRELTYQELNARANQLAHHLHSLGVRSNALIGICAERSLDMVVGLLGILKAGAAYVPFDLAYPKDRLAFMLNDCQVPVLLTQQDLAPGLPPNQAHVLCLDKDWDLISRQSQENLPSEATPENLAYVIYTSGSTGQPKGTLVTHHNVTRLFAATRSWFHFDHRDVWTLFHSYAFDFSVWELWGALLQGGRLVIVPYWISRSPEAFYDLLCAQRVTVLNQTPSAFRQLIQVDEAQPRSLRLRLVIFGGEALELQSLKPWFERHGDHSPQLVNMYGITETTVHVTYRPLTAADLNSTASVIGCPIPDLQVYILDQRLQPVPIGIPGEMYVGGAGLAPSYLHRPELTADRFIPNPFSPQPGARLYKSGDLARYQPNGDIEYFGRLDHQVKIRGFRIELGEIEAVLASHPAVGHTVVAARQDHIGDKLLVAYVVPNPLHTLSVAELRASLKEKLPDYMMPSAFVILDTLPLTANGKIDRRALPPPDVDRPSLGDGFVAPRTDLEKVLAGIYAEALGLKQVSVQENFFELGGHSLLATQVVSRVRDSLKVEVPLPLFFRTGTVAELAAVVLHNEGNKKQVEKIARALEKLKGMSEEEKRNILEMKRKVRSQS